ncbi:MAG: thioesterase family protein [Bacteroidales bacterium]|nr:thioesterase family protein [Bacteroidales bacterium]
MSNNEQPQNLNKSLTKEYKVSENLTAQSMGSGDMPVLATPAMVAMMENTAMLLAQSLLTEGDTTVGSMINTTHLKPSAVDATIVVTATLTSQEGRKLDFEIETVDASNGNTLIGQATHTRFVVGRERFLSKLYGQK